MNKRRVSLLIYIVIVVAIMTSILVGCAKTEPEDAISYLDKISKRANFTITNFDEKESETYIKIDGDKMMMGNDEEHIIFVKSKDKMSIYTKTDGDYLRNDVPLDGASDTNISDILEESIGSLKAEDIKYDKDTKRFVVVDAETYEVTSFTLKNDKMTVYEGEKIVGTIDKVDKTRIEVPKV